MTEFEIVVRDLAVAVGRIEERQMGVITQLSEVKSVVSDFQGALTRQNNAIARLQLTSVTKEDFRALETTILQFPCVTGCAWEASREEGKTDKRMLSINLKTGVWLAIVSVPFAALTTLLTLYITGA